MSLHTTIFGVLVVAVVATVVAVVASLGLDAAMVVGLMAGFATGAVMTLAGGVSWGRALSRDSKSAAVSQAYGGFVLRLGVLVVGFSALAMTGWASPVGFALAFLAGVMVALYRQVKVFGA